MQMRDEDKENLYVTKFGIAFFVVLRRQTPECILPLFVFGGTDRREIFSNSLARQ